MTRSLRKAKRAVVRRTVLAVALPMILVHILQTLFNVVDLFWIGRLGVRELAGVAWASNILMVLSTIIVGISMGCSAIVARCVGEKDFDEAGRTAWHALLIGSSVAIVLALIGYFYIEEALTGLGAEVDIAHIGAEYLRVIFCGSLVMFLMFIGNAILQGSGNMRVPLYATVIATCLNIVLDPWLIFGGGFMPAMGVKGAAWATLISRAVGTVICLSAFFNRDNKIHLRGALLRLNFRIFGRILKVGIPGSVHLTIRSLVALLLVVIVGQFGYKAVAAYGIGLKLLNVAMMPGFGLGSAAAILIGQHLGAKRYMMALRSSLLPSFYNAIIMQGMAVLYVSLSKPIVRMFTMDSEVIVLAAQYLQVTTMAYFAIGVGFVLGKALNGAGDNTSSVLINLVCLAMIQIPLCLFFAFFWEMGPLGIWWGIVVAAFLQAGCTTAWFLTQEWKTRVV